MNKKNYITIAIITLPLVVALTTGMYLLFGLENRGSDSQKFAKEYTEVGEDNVFVYRTKEEIIKLMKYGTGVVYLGFPECPWCQTYAKYLNEVAKEVGVDKIYYYDILEDRTNNTEFYKEIVSILGDNLEHDDEGNLRIFVPNVSFHVGGKIIGNDLETANDTKGFESPKDYWTTEEITELKNTLTTYMEEVYTSSNMCTTCNE